MTGLTQMKGAVDERVDERVAHPEEEYGRLKLLSQLYYSDSEKYQK